MRNGLLISFEGIEGSGKTTQAKTALNALKLEGHRCVFTREPGGAELSEKIRPILLDKANSEMTAICELFLYLASRSQNVAQIIRPALKRGSIVVADRFSDSTVAYQGGGRGLDIEMIRKLNDLATDGLKPDLTILIDIDPVTSLRRSESKDRIEMEDIGFHGRVRREFLRIGEEEPNRVAAVNGDNDVESIHTEIMTIIRRHVAQHAQHHGG
ncbi:MAG: dTMP kinase [bacterium]